MKKHNGYTAVLKAIYRYLLFFAMVAFLVTCCMLLFVDTFADSLNIVLTDTNMSMAAKLTFGNVLLLSLIFMAFDTIRRKWMVERPVKRIVKAAEKMAAGDFSVRIPQMNTFGVDENFNDIIDCFNHIITSW